jgi:superfamily II DNA helicase RecQ
MSVLDESEVERIACELIQRTKRRLPQQGRPSSFVEAVSHERMAIALYCWPHHCTSEEKDELLAAWMDGREKTLVATSALGTGIDTA